MIAFSGRINKTPPKHKDVDSPNWKDHMKPNSEMSSTFYMPQP